MGALDVVKTTLNLPSQELAALKGLAERRSISMTHALRQAIQTELFTQRLIDEGTALLAQTRNGDIQNSPSPRQLDQRLAIDLPSRPSRPAARSSFSITG